LAAILRAKISAVPPGQARRRISRYTQMDLGVASSRQNMSNGYQFMTPDEIKEWDECGCVSRSLLKIADMDRKHITRDDFCARFGHRLDDNGFFAALNSLSLPISAKTDDYALVSKAFNQEHKRVLVFSEIDLAPGGTNVVHHCSVLTSVDETGFSLWTPLQNGTDIHLNLTKDYWASKQCSGMILG
jgi:hypothetical protein